MTPPASDSFLSADGSFSKCSRSTGTPCVFVPSEQSAPVLPSLNHTQAQQLEDKEKQMKERDVLYQERSAQREAKVADIFTLFV